MSNTIQLSVNLNKVALLRNSRGENQPNLLKTAHDILRYGASGLTVHPRSDCRHILPCDVSQLAEVCNQKRVELNVEGNPLANKTGNYPGFLQIIQTVKPQQCTLVPDDAFQITSNHGWNLWEEKEHLTFAINEIKKVGCRISVFMDAENADQFAELKAMGAHRVELYTQNFAKAYEAAFVVGDESNFEEAPPYKADTFATTGNNNKAQQTSRDKNKLHNSMSSAQNNAIEVFNNTLQNYHVAAKKAVAAGLKVNAGHGLNLDNVKEICGLPGLCELSIGHAIICEALESGLQKVIENYIQKIVAS